MHKKKPSDNTKLGFRTILFRGVLYVIIIPAVIMLVIFGIFYKNLLLMIILLNHICSHTSNVSMAKNL